MVILTLAFRHVQLQPLQDSAAKSGGGIQRQLPLLRRATSILLPAVASTGGEDGGDGGAKGEAVEDDGGEC